MSGDFVGWRSGWFAAELVDSADVEAERGSHELPWVLSSSLQCGDQIRDVTEVFIVIVCRGDEVVEVDLTLHMRIFPSGKVEPDASKSGCQGHHPRA